MNMITLKIIIGLLLIAFALTSNLYVGIGLFISAFFFVSEKFNWTHVFHQKCSYKFSRDYF